MNDLIFIGVLIFLVIVQTIVICLYRAKVNYLEMSVSGHDKIINKLIYCEGLGTENLEGLTENVSKIIEILKKLKDNDIEMVIVNNPGPTNSVLVKFYKHQTHEYFSTRRYDVTISIDELEASNASFDILLGVHLDYFLSKLKIDGVVANAMVKENN